MNGLQDMIFIGEITLQAKIAKRAAERLLATHETFDHIETWCSIQSILGAAGNISKILWPSEREYKIRGERLRQLLRIEKNNPLSRRRFRNHFEHYDARIEEWFENNASGVYIDLAMNPSLTNPIFNNTPKYAHRGYNSFNNSVVFRDEILDLDEVLKALDDILHNCSSY